MKGILLAIGVVFVLFVVILAGTAIGVYNECVEMETTIEAQYKQNQNNYDNFFKSVVEIAQVSDKYKDALKDVFMGAIQGRYGKDGSKATWAWLQEHNPNLDASVYTKIQQVIESGRKNFEINQKMLIDKKQVYQLQLRGFPSGVFARILGFPKIDLSKFDIVTSDRTEKAFETKKDEPIKL